MSHRFDLQVRIAREAWEFEAIHRLNHRTFAEEIPQHAASPTGRLVDRFHDENEYAICLDGRTLAGMAAIRGRRPFSLDLKLPDLDRYLPAGRSVCELRLLAVEKGYRATAVLPELLAFVWSRCLARGFDAAVISGTTRQLRLYGRLGFVPFGPRVGSAEAEFQPMLLTLETFAGRARDLFRAVPARPSRASASFLPGPVTVADRVRELGVARHRT